MAQLFDATISTNLMPVPHYNICPTQTITTVTSDGETRRLLAMRWGFLPTWYKSPRDGPLLINARGETVATKPAFRDACRHRRCLIPASGYYEWSKTNIGDRQPWYISPKNSEPLVFAGIWQTWHQPDGENLTTCAIVTTAASTHLSAIHHRMPVLISAADQGLWLGETGKGAAALMVSDTTDSLTCRRVSPRVNSNRPDDADLIAPIYE